MKKRVLSIFLILIVSLGIFSQGLNVLANEQTDINKNHKELEGNKNYSRAYLEYLKLSDEEKAKVKVIPRKYNIPLDSIYEDTIEVKEKPSLFNLYGLRAKTNIVSTYSEELPDTFDLRDKIKIDTKDQKNYGLCWAFASMRSLETNLALNGYGDYDFSELHLAYIEKNGFGNVIDENSGGNFWEFEEYTTNNYGPVLEDEVPYDSIYTEDQYEYLNDLESKAYVSKTIDFPTIDKMYDSYTKEQLNLFRDKVKKHIMENGSIYVSIAAGEIKDINENTTLYNTTQPINHAVCVIGWDDNFSRENFEDENGEIPNNDGAYIALNSWGKSDEVIYISYEDITVERDMSGVVNATTKSEEVAKEIKFEDENLYKALKEELGRNVLTYDDKTMKITCFNNISILDLSHKGINDLNGLENFTNLKTLKLQGNNITDMSLLWTIKSLEDINISENNLENLGDISNMPNLTILNISNNQIAEISNVTVLDKLVNLDISGNRIEDINFIKDLKKLENISLMYNNIQDVSCLSLLEHQFFLNLSGNPIKDGLNKLTNISEIILDDCNLDDNVIDILSNLDNIKSISLRNNNITDVSKLENLSLYYLDLSGNRSINLNTMLAALNKSKDNGGYSYGLILENCNITDINTFRNFKGGLLDLSNNPIKDITPLENIEIDSLYLRNTDIRDVSSLNKVVNLDLSDNKSLTGLDNLSSVKWLNLNNCEINNISSISNLINLESLELENNNISNIYDIANLSNLMNLDVSHNNITDIPDLSSCNSLSNIDFSYNNITNIDNLKNWLQYGYVNLSNNHISDVIDENSDNYFGLQNQILRTDIDVKVNKDNRIKIPTVLKKSYETRFKNWEFGKSGYESQTKFKTENCTIDFKNDRIIINPTELGEGAATINVKGGIYDGTVYTINYNSQEEMDLLGIELKKLPDNLAYCGGDDFDRTGMIVEEIYENDVREEITDYSIINGTNLKEGQETVTIRSNKNPNLEVKVNIKVYAKDKLVETEFPDNNLYSSIKDESAFIDERIRPIENIILDYNDDTNTIVMFKDKVEEIKFLNFNNGNNITNLSGIECFTNLEEINLRDNVNLETIDTLDKLNNISYVNLIGTKVINIENLLRNESIKNIDIRNINRKVIETDQQLIELPDFIYQSLVLQSDVTAQAYIYYDTDYYEEGNEYIITENENRKAIEIKLDKEKQIATVELDKEITEEKLEGVRGISITINGGKTSGALYEMVYKVNYELAGIKISEEPIKTEYIEGQTFDKTGMVVTANYNHGTSKEITNYTVTPSGALTPSDNKVTISYTENNVTKTVELPITVKAKEEPKPILKGDANGDGKVDFMDILAINKHRLGKAQLEGVHLEAADVTGDGNIDFMDILQINKYRLGKIDSL